MDETKIILAGVIKEYCKKLDMAYYAAIRYLSFNKYLYRILKGVFYKPSVEERKFKRMDINYLDAISEALRIKKINNWYLGLETAIKFNKLTHESFVTDYIVNDTIFRDKPIRVLGHNIKFVKLKKNLFNFGICRNNEIPYSDNEKTILDIIYLSRYKGMNDAEIKNKISGLLKYCSEEKLLEYSKNYNKAVKKFIRGNV